MLDFLKLGRLISQISAESLTERQDKKFALSEALHVFARQCQDDQTFADKLVTNAPGILWPTAVPLEPLSMVQNVLPLKTSVTPWTVVGVDGSQIMPSHHEVHRLLSAQLRAGAHLLRSGSADGHVFRAEALRSPGGSLPFGRSPTHLYR